MLKRFLASYVAHPAGLPHRLVVQAKGWDGVSGRDRLTGLEREHGASIVDLTDDGFD